MRHALLITFSLLLLGAAVAVPTLMTTAQKTQKAQKTVEAQKSVEAKKSYDVRPPLAEGHIRGVTLAHVHRRGRGYGSQRSAQTLTRLRELGVNWVAIVMFAYQRNADDATLRGDFTGDGERSDSSMTDRDIAREIEAAHERGMKVLLKPHVWSHDFWQGDQWHGTIDQNSPQAHDQWWQAYRQYILHYARLAQKHDADGLCLGTELVKMTEKHEDEWRALIRDVRAVYDGPLTYAAHWDTEFDRVTFWDELDAIGIAAYFPLDAPPDASVEELVNAWQPHIERMAKLREKYDKPIVFLEAGYRPVKATHREPWLHEGGEPDANAQERAYRAMFAALADESWWHGVFLWKTFTDPQRRGRRDRLNFAFLGRPAEQIVKEWFAMPIATDKSE